MRAGVHVMIHECGRRGEQSDGGVSEVWTLTSRDARPNQTDLHGLVTADCS